MKLTQAELADKINYSDKAVSKWERGESIPDVTILISLARLFEVSLDFLVTEHVAVTEIKEQTQYFKRIKNRNRFLISAITIFAVLAMCTIAFVILQSIKTDKKNLLYCYVYPLPVSFLLAIIFSSVWGKRILTFIFVSGLIWTGLLDIFLFAGCTIPFIFLIGIPAEVITMMSFKIITVKKITLKK